MSTMLARPSVTCCSALLRNCSHAGDSGLAWIRDNTEARLEWIRESEDGRRLFSLSITALD